MGAADGQIRGVRPVWESGPRNKRWNLVLVADGYRDDELERFRDDGWSFRNHLFATAPFSSAAVRAGINIFAVDVASVESGADHPDCGSGGPATFARTFFDSTYCYDGETERLLYGNAELTIDTVTVLLPGWHQILVLVNDGDYGGAGGDVAWSCNSSADWRDVAIHELGHSAFKLADEYDYGGPARWPGGDPEEPNVSDEPDPYVVKWSARSSQGLPTPARSNPNWKDPVWREDPGPNPWPAGTVGTFEGGFYSGADLFRPEWDCKMRHTAAPFCAVCTDRIAAVLATFALP
jgi:hypothetical protein